MILGCCSNPLGTVMTALQRAGCDYPTLIGSGQPGPSTAHLVTSVRRLREVAPFLTGSRTVVVVHDALEALREIEHVDVIDAYGTGWTPGPIRMRHLRAMVASLDPVPAITFRANPVLDQLVEESRKRGVFGAVLGYAQRLGGSQERDAINAAVVRYLAGQLALSTLRRRTAPRRDALVEAHAAMCDALGSDHGFTLSRAVRDALRGVDPREAADMHGADAFEVRFTLYHHARARGGSTPREERRKRSASPRASTSAGEGPRLTRTG